jgi:hypothetical protein
VIVLKDAVIASRPSGVESCDGCGINVLTNPAPEPVEDACAEMTGNDNVARLAKIIATAN